MVPVVGGHDLDLLAQSNDSNKMLIEVFNNDYSIVACETFTCGSSRSCENFTLAQIFASLEIQWRERIWRDDSGVLLIEEY
jgi:hypothetical protein